MVAALEQALRARGLRVTEQRRLVLDAVESLQHCTPEQVLAHVQEQAPALNLSTVYRTLELLQDLGLVTHAHLDHGAPTYHSTRGKEHLHLVCRSCGKVEEAPADAAHQLAATLLQQKGFISDVRHLAVHGTCRDCAGE
jgi:Fur family ferric uptake transcriptional regulator